MTDNPFTVLTAVVAPAILTNACSVLALGTGNRIARAVDRTWTVVARLAAAEPGSPEHATHTAHLAVLRRRSRLLLFSLRALYAALGAFASAALISVIGALAALYDLTSIYHLAAVVALVAGVSAVLGLVTGCILMVTETHLALQSMNNEIEQALNHQH
jgi:hypothetical protein